MHSLSCTEQQTMGECETLNGKTDTNVDLSLCTLRRHALSAEFHIISLIIHVNKVFSVQGCTRSKGPCYQKVNFRLFNIFLALLASQLTHQVLETSLCRFASGLAFSGAALRSVAHILDNFLCKQGNWHLPRLRVWALSGSPITMDVIGTGRGGGGH